MLTRIVGNSLCLMETARESAIVVASVAAFCGSLAQVGEGPTLAKVRRGVYEAVPTSEGA
jgi:hypothetical protein